jgi:bilirubin oxidase
MLSNPFFLSSLLFGLAIADGGWLSPVYKHFYEFPLPIPPIKTPLTFVTPPFPHENP